MDADVRGRLVELVQAYPGLHLRELARQAGTSEALAGYHLEQLVAARRIVAVEDANNRRYYSLGASAPDASDRQIMNLLRQRVTFAIALRLVERPGSTNQHLSQALALAPSTLSYHLAKLERRGLLQREGAGWHLKEPRRVQDLMERWRPPADWADRFESVWRRLYGKD